MSTPTVATSRLTRINECFLTLSADSFDNINRFVALCGDLMGATCALYNRLYRDTLFSLGQWNTPPDFNPEDRPDGHICYDVIKGGRDTSLLVRNLPNTDYFRTDPNVEAYQLQTYVGRVVKCHNTCVGSLCVVFQKDYIPTQEDEELMGMIASAIAVEEERLKVSEEAVRDILTGLYNRRYFNHRLDEEINRAEQDGLTLGILLCDIDQFREVNSVYGHQKADEILKAVARSFQDSTRGIDSVFRWGGDEIVVVLKDPDRDSLLNIADRIRRGVHEVGGKVEHDLDVSIGAAVYPEHGDSVDILLDVAERALFIAKNSGDKINIGEEQYRLSEKSIQVVFQPIIDSSSNETIGHEALSRDPDGKLSILQLFEKYRAIGRLQELKCICYAAQLKAAQQAGLERVFINVEFDLLHQIEYIPKPEDMEVILEISEVEALRDIEKYLKTVQHWRTKGFKFAIDDFGAGFISLPFIAQAVPDYIKLDRSTIRHAVTSKKFRKFARELTRALYNYTAEGIIAEGVELEEELEVVKELGVDLVQGFLFGKPGPIARGTSKRRAKTRH
jgi:diguanylate cyclase (GGDEF)-like protein